MNETPPRVSVGMPVFNGERYITQAIDSILSQTFTDLELIISDNASTDGTGRICRRYAAADSRVSYHRSDSNRGAAWNHNRLVELARGEYFKWQCHDDYCDSTFLEKCLAVLDSDPGVVLCYPRFVRVDELGRALGVKSSRVLGEAQPYLRFRSMIYRRDSCEEIYGLARTTVIRKTAMIGTYSNSDDTFLAEMILHGRFREVPEPLFFYRIHPTQSTRAYPSRSERMAWFRPDAGTHFPLPSVRLFGGYISLLWRSPLPQREKLRCYSYLPGWCWHFRAWFRQDFRAAISPLTHGKSGPSTTHHAPWTRPLWQVMKAVARRWRRPESAANRAKRLRRAQLERWDLSPKE